MVGGMRLDGFIDGKRDCRRCVQKVVEDGFKATLLDGCHRYSTVRQLMAEGAQKPAEHRLLVIQVIGNDGQAF